MPAPPLAPGALLSGRYQLIEALGESDLSRVYAAADQRGQAQVALKVLDRGVLARPAALSEYQAQARQASGLGVEGIARAYDFGIDANSGLPFNTSERIGWASLDRRVLAQGPLGVVELSRALSVLARALDAAHTARLLHRDLKPQNVFISPQNPEWVRITDFGMSAVRRGAPEAMGWGGPAGYTPPDAVDASAPGSAGADLFALGVIAFFALTRGSPFRSLRNPGFDPNAHWAELNQPLYPISERAKEIGVALDPALDPWFLRALALQPQDRFRSAGEMARELSALAEQAGLRGAGGPRTMPGIAAAIAQPLLFQPEPSSASLGLGAMSQTAPLGIAIARPAALPKASPAAAEPVAAAPVAAATPPSAVEEPIAGLPKHRGAALPLLVGLGVLLLGGLAFAGYLVLGKRSGRQASAEPSASAPASSAPIPAATTVVTTAPSRARFTCQPEACEWVVCDGKNVSSITEEVELTPGAHECSASRNGFSSQAATFTASPGQVSAVVFELSALPPANPPKAADANAAPAKPGNAAPATAKPAAAAAKPAAKPAAAKPAPAKPKKKCSTFLGCK